MNTTLLMTKNKLPRKSEESVKIGTDDWNTILIDHNRAPRLGGPSWGGPTPRGNRGDTLPPATASRECILPRMGGPLGLWANQPKGMLT